MISKGIQTRYSNLNLYIKQLQTCYKRRFSRAWFIYIHKTSV